MPTWPIDESRGAFISEDGLHATLVEGHGAESRVLVDGVPGPKFDLLPQSVLLSRNGKRVAYVAKRGPDRWVAVVDGVARPEYGDAAAEFGERSEGYRPFRQPLAFSPDGKRVACAVRKEGKLLVVIDGVAGPAFEGTLGSRVIFSADGKHVAYVLRHNGKYVVVADGVPGPEYEHVYEPALSPDGGRVAYMAQLGWHRAAAVVDGKPGPEYDTVCELRLSPDGQRVTYRAFQGKKQLVIVDGVPGPEYDGALDLTLSPDGRRVCYRAGQHGKNIAVVDGVPGPEYDWIANFCLSPDGKRVAYAAKQGDKFFLVVDGVPEPAHDNVCPQFPVFSPDGRHFAYVSQSEGEGDRWFVVVDGVPGPELRRGLVGRPEFSPDSKQVACITEEGGSFSLVVGTAVGPDYERIIGPAHLFHDNGVLEYLAIKYDKLYRVKHVPTPDN
jgi:hypothetical protein